VWGEELFSEPPAAAGCLAGIAGLAGLKTAVPEQIGKSIEVFSAKMGKSGQI
jgi:hypothetical protein